MHLYLYGERVCGKGLWGGWVTGAVNWECVGGVDGSGWWWLFSWLVVVVVVGGGCDGN